MQAREVLDSRDHPTLEVEVAMDDGSAARASRSSSVISDCEPFLRHALADLREAIGMRATDTPFYCYRALESLCHFMRKKGLDPEDREAAWKAMHEELRTSRHFIAEYGEEGGLGAARQAAAHNRCRARGVPPQDVDRSPPVLRLCAPGVSWLR